MKPDKIKSIVAEKLTEIAELAKHIGESFDKDAIHKFRVAVKSLRSFLRLQKIYTGNPKIKLTKKFKCLYDIAGAIRETQLEIDFFKKNEPGLQHYAEQLQQALIIQQQAWQEHYSQKILHKLSDKLAGLEYNAIHPSQLTHFFTNRMTAISDIAHSSAPSDNEIHDARKKIKDMLYTAKTAEKKWKAASKHIKALPLEKLDKLSDEIGNYNDERIIVAHVAAFSAEGIDKNEKNAIEHFKGRETKKLTKKKKSIFSAAQSLIKTDKGN